jgi:hypothetical protein
MLLENVEQYVLHVLDGHLLIQIANVQGIVRGLLRLPTFNLIRANSRQGVGQTRQLHLKEDIIIPSPLC